jgi:hypothetical protein
VIGADDNCVVVELFVRTTTDANELRFPTICHSEAVEENFLHLVSAVAAIVAGSKWANYHFSDELAIGAFTRSTKSVSARESNQVDRNQVDQEVEQNLLIV